jgi:hypothetical protein
MSDFDKTIASSANWTCGPSAAGASSSSAVIASSAGAKSASEFNYRLPSEVTLKHAVKLSIVEDKPIMLDYWTASLDKKALIGAKESGEKLLVKSEDEYTSGISKICKSGAEFIIITENSIYIVSADIPPRKIS